MLPIYKEIDLDKLKLDTHNPRIPKSLQGGSEKDILSFMLLDASLIELMLAIGVNGFFKGEQLLVVKNKDNTYKVVEGNRRLSSVKLLNNPELAEVQKSKVEKVIQETTHRPLKLPCLVFDNDAEIHNYLGYKHITGIKEWKLLEKARYLYNQKELNFKEKTHIEAARELAKTIGSRTDYVNRILVGYDIYRTIEDNYFYKIRDLDDTTFYFNYIADSLNKSNISEFLGVNLTLENPLEKLNDNNLRKWTSWLFEKNDQNKTRLIGDSYDLKSLNAIMGNEEALKAFDEGMSLTEAEEITNIVDEQFKNYISKSLKNIESADRLVVRLKDNNSNVDDDLKTIRAVALKIVRTLQEKSEEI
jgi:hypothetical protein